MAEGVGTHVGVCALLLGCDAHLPLVVLLHLVAAIRDVALQEGLDHWAVGLHQIASRGQGILFVVMLSSCCTAAESATIYKIRLWQLWRSVKRAMACMQTPTCLSNPCLATRFLWARSSASKAAAISA